MNKIIKSIKFLIVLIFLSSPILGVGEAGAIFLLIAPGAAAQGTGEANVAAVQDAYSSYYNPASLAFQEKTSYGLMHVNWLKSLVPDLYYEYLGFSRPYGDIGGIGGHFIFLSLGEQIATDELGTYIGEFSSYMAAGDVSFGTKLTENSALGLGFKIFHQKLSEEAYSNDEGGGVGGEEGKPFSTDFAFDIAYLYKLEHNSISENILSSEAGLVVNGNKKAEDKFRFGFNIANIGPKIGFIDEEQADPAPTNMRLGIFANLFSDDYIKFNMLMDVQKLLVTRYPAMDWNGDRVISGDNEIAHDDPWYIAWATAWLDDWYFGGDYDYDGDGHIGGYEWVDIDGDGEMIEDEIIGELGGDGPYSEWINDSEGSKLELGSGDDRKFSDELRELIINTGFEFWYTENFVLRLGYIYDDEGDIKNPTFGAGLRFQGYGFDFGYTAGPEHHPRTNSLFFSISMEM